MLRGVCQVRVHRHIYPRTIHPMRGAFLQDTANVGWCGACGPGLVTLALGRPRTAVRPHYEGLP